MTNTTDNTTPSLGSWGDQKAKLKVKYPQLTDDDLYYAIGKKDEMLEKIQVKIGKTKEELDAIIASL